MKTSKITDVSRTYFIARELAADAVDRICRPREPKELPGTEYHTCPACGGLLTEEHRHCHWCGQSLIWQKESMQ